MMNVLVQNPGQASASLEALQMREIDLRQMIARLDAQQPILTQQTRVGQPYLREQAERQLLDNQLQGASARAELAAVREQIAVRGGRPSRPIPGTTPAPPQARSFLDRIDSDAITAMFVMTTLAILVPLSVGITRRLWRRAPAPQPTSALVDMARRMERMEQAVDAVAIEVERISESQRFVAKVLVERPTPQRTPVPDETSSALGEAKPFLALGAGPIEPIPVVQRQAVKQSVTPH